MNGVAALMLVETGAQCIGSHTSRFLKKRGHGRSRIDGIVGRDHNLHAVACGQHQRLQDALARRQIVEGRGQRALRERQPFPHLYRRGLVTDSGDQKFHRNQRLCNCACAAHVRAEHPSAVMASTAALRPLQPADTRRKTIAK